MHLFASRIELSVLRHAWLRGNWNKRF